MNLWQLLKTLFNKESIRKNLLLPILLGSMYGLGIFLPYYLTKTEAGIKCSTSVLSILA